MARILLVDDDADFGTALQRALDEHGYGVHYVERAQGAAELLLTNRRLSAEEALAAGLVTRVLDDDELLAAADELARRLAGGPTLAYARVKKLLRRSAAATDFEAQLEDERREVGRSAATADFVEGLRAFAEKRRPEFRGE